ILTLVLGLLVTAAFCMLIYILTFYTISRQGLRRLFTSAAGFFSGGVIPLPFFPEPLQNVIELLPFASMQNVSLRIYSGSMGPDKMEKAILLQLFWLVTLIFTGKILCRRAEKKITVQGG
ncbi:MAG: ABC-2 family transporter protein, partial [Lachnospiraceae bacterium]|nr:ABC-2 family transporter protein [Lachnospiraceae bacterium]